MATGLSQWQPVRHELSDQQLKQTFLLAEIASDISWRRFVFASKVQMHTAHQRWYDIPYKFTSHFTYFTCYHYYLFTTNTLSSAASLYSVQQQKQQQ